MTSFRQSENTDLLHLLENMFDRKHISANSSPNPNANTNTNPNPNPNPTLTLTLRLG